MPLTGREKATIFLSLLGAETSARILRYLPDELADLIAAGINHLPTPSPAALSEVLSEFQSFLSLPESEIEERPRLEHKPKPSRPRRSYAFLMYERPQMVAYLLSLLPEEQRTDALLSLPREKVMIEELLFNLRKNSLSSRLEEDLKKNFKEKLF